MARNTYIHIAPPRRLPRGWVMVAAAIVGIALAAAWSRFGPRAGNVPPHVPPAPSGHAAVARGPAPALAQAQTKTQAQAQAQMQVQAHVQVPAPVFAASPAVRLARQARFAPPGSTMVSPGVHVTPLSVPAGTLPGPAGPRPHDSEPEN